jgi:hypothetical protein
LRFLQRFISYKRGFTVLEHAPLNQFFSLFKHIN